MSWAKGRDVIEDLLTRATSSRSLRTPTRRSTFLGARVHLATAAQMVDTDPEIAYDALYAAARKALTAVLRQQGLRPTRVGGHEAVIQATEAQLVPPLGAVLRPYRRLRRQRGRGDYMASEGAINPDDVLADLPASTDIVEAAEKVVPQMPVYVRLRQDH